MKGLNRAFFIGRVGHEPEVRSTAAGLAVVRVSVGVPNAKKVNGEWEEEMEWHRLVAFGKEGEFVARYGHKGDPLAVECSVRNNRWTDKEGKLHYDTNFVIDRILWLGSRRGSATQPIDAAPAEVQPDRGSEDEGRAAESEGDGIPF